MELVYLWIEEYKNIKKQGFNFSPRFKCEFDGENLTIEEDENYISIFPKNINITAIVGENGSGKSTILEALICIMHNRDIPWDEYKISAIFYDIDKNCFLQKNINFSLNLKKDYPSLDYSLEKKKKKYNNFLFYYNYTLDSLTNEENNMDFNELYHKSDDYETPILLQPTKNNNIIDLNIMDYLANLNILHFYINKEIEIENIKNFFSLDKYNTFFSYKNIYKNEYEYPEFKEKLAEIYNNPLLTTYDDSETGKDGFLKYCNKLEYLTINGLIFVTNIYIIRKILDKLIHGAHFVIDKSFKKLVKELHIERETQKNVKLKRIVKEPEIQKKKERLNKILDYIANKNFDDLFKDETEYKLVKIKNSFNFIKYLKSTKESYHIASDMQKVNENKNFLNNIPPWINIEFFNKEDVSFSFLSYGQKFLIKFLYSILNQLNNLKSHIEYSSIILLLDELELGLHPKWQKEYLSLLISVLQLFIPRYKFNIICATHSPFILSDLPKEDVLFLKKGEVCNPDIKQTFGANIHTLLSNGFFMENGLMGEFAKNKIEEIKKFYELIKKLEAKIQSKNRTKQLVKNSFEKRKKGFYHIQSIIGEPFLQTIIKNYLDEIVFILSDDNTLIDNEIDQLKAKIEKLKSLKND